LSGGVLKFIGGILSAAEMGRAETRIRRVVAAIRQIKAAISRVKATIDRAKVAIGLMMAAMRQAIAAIGRTETAIDRAEAIRKRIIAGKKRIKATMGLIKVAMERAGRSFEDNILSREVSESRRVQHWGYRRRRGRARCGVALLTLCARIRHIEVKAVIISAKILAVPK